MGAPQSFARLHWMGRGEHLPPAARLLLHARVLPSAGHPASQPEQNRLLHGDNLAVMLALLPEFEGKFDLIYADPPFLTGKHFRARTGVREDSRRPADWQTSPGYPDTWRDGAEYLGMLYPRLTLMHRLLGSNGTLYLHLDWRAAAYAKVLLDEIFGYDRMLNEIIWVYHGPSPIRSAFKRKHDTILAYTKSKRYTFNAEAVRVPYDQSTWKTFSSSPRAGFGKTPELARGKVPEDWWYFPVVARLHQERTGYPTQKPEALIERILLASSHPGDLVGDFFCGSGTLPAVATRTDRRWFACDAQQLAINISWRRLLLGTPIPAFSVWRQDGVPMAEPLEPELRLAVDGAQLTARLHGLGPTAAGSEFPDCLGSLEVDWDYDGRTFTSRSQLTRGWRASPIDPVLRRRITRPGPTQVAARAVDRTGREGISAVEAKLNV